MADLFLNDVLDSKINVKDFLRWLKLNHSEVEDKTFPLDSSLFIRYFVNHVRENCSWVLNKNVKNCNPSTPKKPTKSIASVKDFKGDNNVGTFDVDKSGEKYECRIRRLSPNDRDGIHKVEIPSENIALTNKSKNLNFKTCNVLASLSVSDQNALALSPVDKRSIGGKGKKRITPTPVQTTNEASAKFIQADFASPPPKVSNDFFKVSPFVQADVNLKNEREILKLTKTKLLQDPGAKLPKSVTKGLPNQSPDTESLQYVTPDPKLVTVKDQLQIFSQIYNLLLTEAMVPNIVAELYFLFELITAKITTKDKSQKDNAFSSIHNCVHFAVSVLHQQHDLLLLLDNTTIALMSKITFLYDFSPDLVMLLQMSLLNTNNDTKLLTSLKTNNDVKLLTSNYLPHFFQKDKFQAEDNADVARQQNLFHELLQEWQMQSFNCTDSKFRDRFAYKVRSLMKSVSSRADLYQLALLFESQLVARCMCSEINEGSDAMLSDIQKHFPGKFEKLQERFVTPFSTGEPNPPPKFHGVQRFFIEFLQHASSPAFNQYLLNVFTSKILELNDFDTHLLPDSNCTKQIYTFLVLVLRLLGKFLGYVYFLPYSESTILAANIVSYHLSFRKHRAIPIDALKLLKVAVHKQRTILTVPWIVEFLSMIDTVAKHFEEVQDVLKILHIIYRGSSAICIQKDNHLFLRLLVGWLLDILDYTEPCNDGYALELLQGDNIQGIDSEQMVDKQLIHSCCLFLTEFKVLIYNFIHGIRSKKQKVRKITPLTTAKPKLSSTNKQEIESQLKETFPALRTSSVKKIVKTIRFISGRMSSKVIRKINIELQNIKLQKADNVHRIRQESGQAAENNPFDQNQQSTEHTLNLLKTFKSCDFISNACFTEVKTLMSLLLAEDIKCTGDELLEVCSKLSLQLTCHKIVNWCDTNLSIEDIKCDFYPSLKPSVKVVANVETIELSVSNTLNFFRRLAVNVHSKSILSLPEKIFPMLSVARDFVEHKHIQDSSKKLLILITIDLYIGLLTFSPDLCCDTLSDAFRNLWSNCPRDCLSESSFLCHQHVKILLSSKDLAVSWTKYASMISALICDKKLEIRELKKCLKSLRKSTWSGLDLSDHFNYLKSTLRDFEENHPEHKSKS